MENQNRCKSIKQAELIVNVHKHNLLNSFCNNGYVYVIQLENNNNQRDRDRETENALVPVTVESVVLEKKIKCLEMR